MMKIWVALPLLWAGSVFAQETTPYARLVAKDGTVTVLTKEDYDRVQYVLANYDDIKANLKNLATIEEAKPKLELSGIKVVIDDQDRVFVDENVSGTLEVGYLNYDVQVKLDSKIDRVKTKEGIFRARLKFLAGITLEVDDQILQGSTVEGGYAFGVAFQFLEFGRWGVDAVLTSRQWGGGLSFRFTKNGGIVVAVGPTWDGDLAFGCYLGFNF